MTRTDEKPAPDTITAGAVEHDFKTITEAKSAGYRKVRHGEYGGERITVKGHSLVRNPERAKSRTEWLRIGCVVPEGTEPHAVVGGRVGNAHRKWEVFRADQVHEVEHSARARRAAAAQKAASTRRANLLQQAKEVPIRVQALPFDDLLRLAIDHFNARRRDDTALAAADSDPGFLARITVNFVRHELTHYDDVLAACGGRTGKEEAISIIRDRVYDSIESAYPELEDECWRQRVSRDRHE